MIFKDHIGHIIFYEDDRTKHQILKHQRNMVGNLHQWETGGKIIPRKKSN